MIHHVFANKSNIGDWLSAIGIQQLLAPDRVVEHLCDEPFVADTIAALEVVDSTDLIVIGGGGLFMDYFELFWRQFEAIAQRIPFVVWGVGCCDLKQQPSHAAIDLLRRIVGSARGCFVRDEVTRRFLNLPDVLAPSGCPSLCALASRPVEAKGLLHVDNYTTAGATVYERMDAAAEKFAAATGRELRRVNNRIEPGRRDQLEHCLLAYQRSDLVLSSALHGCILALAMGRKVLAVSGDWKIEGFMELVGLRDCVLSLDQLDQIPDRLHKLSDQPSSFARIEDLRSANRNIASRVRKLTP